MAVGVGATQALRRGEVGGWGARKGRGDVGREGCGGGGEPGLAGAGVALMEPSDEDEDEVLLEESREDSELDSSRGGHTSCSGSFLAFGSVK
jgi:hypothetical protein